MKNFCILISFLSTVYWCTGVFSYMFDPAVFYLLVKVLGLYTCSSSMTCQFKQVCSCQDLFPHISTFQQCIMDVQYCMFLTVQYTYYISAQLPKCNKSEVSIEVLHTAVYHLNNAFQTPLGSGEPPQLIPSLTLLKANTRICFSAGFWVVLFGVNPCYSFCSEYFLTHSCAYWSWSHFLLLKQNTLFFFNDHSCLFSWFINQLYSYYIYLYIYIELHIFQNNTYEF